MIAKVARIVNRVGSAVILLSILGGLLVALIVTHGILKTIAMLGVLGILMWSVHTVVWWICK